MVVLYAASMLGSMLLFSFVHDRQQKFRFAGMSRRSSASSSGVPAGVGIYWITTNIWTICQNGLVKRTMGHHFPVVEKQEKAKAGKAAPDLPEPTKNPASGGDARPPEPSEEAAMTEYERVEVETSGETVGEARWAALHELELAVPALQRDDVQFVVLSEGERGLLGVGYQPARVLASVEVDPAAAEPVVARRLGAGR